MTGSGVEIVPHPDEPGLWQVISGGVRQSYVDPEDPLRLHAAYVGAMALVLDHHPLAAPAPLRALHVGGGAGTLVRWLGAVRPGSTQTVLEPDEAVTDAVREALPYPEGVDPHVVAVDGRTGLGNLADASQDVVVVDAFADGRVPPELVSVECLLEVRRVLAPDGVLVCNVVEGPGDPGQESVFTRRVLATYGAAFDHVAAIGFPTVMLSQRFGNVTVIGSRAPLDDLTEAAAALSPRQAYVAGDLLRQFVGDARPATHEDPALSPAPPNVRDA